MTHKLLTFPSLGSFILGVVDLDGLGVIPFGASRFLPPLPLSPVELFAGGAEIFGFF